MVDSLLDNVRGVFRFLSLSAFPSYFACIKRSRIDSRCGFLYAFGSLSIHSAHTDQSTRLNLDRFAAKQATRTQLDQPLLACFVVLFRLSFCLLASRNRRNSSVVFVFWPHGRFDKDETLTRSVCFPFVIGVLVESAWLSLVWHQHLIITAALFDRN
jgi:hypothetical protein